MNFITQVKVEFVLLLSVEEPALTMDAFNKTITKLISCAESQDDMDICTALGGVTDILRGTETVYSLTDDYAPASDALHNFISKVLINLLNGEPVIRCISRRLCYMLRGPVVPPMMNFGERNRNDRLYQPNVPHFAAFRPSSMVHSPLHGATFGEHGHPSRASSPGEDIF